MVKRKLAWFSCLAVAVGAGTSGFPEKLRRGVRTYAPNVKQRIGTSLNATKVGKTDRLTLWLVQRVQYNKKAHSIWAVGFSPVSQLALS